MNLPNSPNNPNNSNNYKYPIFRVLIGFTVSAQLIMLMIWLLVRCEIKNHDLNINLDFYLNSMSCQLNHILTISNEKLWDLMIQTTLCATVPACLLGIWVISGRYTRSYFLETMFSGVIISVLYAGAMHFLLLGTKWAILFHSVAVIFIYPLFSLIFSLFCALIWLPKTSLITK